MSDKPSYLGLLNAGAGGEVGGEQLFTTWAAATPNDEVRQVLRTVALREAEHARSFAKRIDELGFSVREKADPGLAARVATAASDELTDAEKFERLGFARPLGDGPDIFARFFDDVTIDIRTGELLGRYLSEERDTGRLLRECYATIAPSPPSSDANATTSSSKKQAAAKSKSKSASKAKVTAKA